MSFFAVLLAVLAAILLWAALIEPRLILEENTYEVDIPNLPESWQGRTVALVADFQVGMFLHNLNMVRRVVRRLLEQKPDLVLIAGDFIHQPPESLTPSLRTVLGLLKPLLDSELPVYGVLGNHDYGIGVRQDEGKAYAGQVKEALEAAGIRILKNEALELPGGLYLVGVGEHEFAEDDVESALEGLPGDAPRIVMMHNPKSFRELPPYTAPLAVAGHTHGGQVRAPFRGDRFLLTPRGSKEVNIASWVDKDGEGDYGQPGNRLYITRGTGFSMVPMRFFAPPELTFFKLRAAAGAKAASPRTLKGKP